MNRIRLVFKYLLVFCLSNFAYALELPEVKIGAYADAYYVWDNNDPSNAKTDSPRPISGTNLTKNQISLNTAQLSAVINYQDMIRGNFTFHAGDIRRSCYSNISTTPYPDIQSANFGLKIYDNLWMDAGYFRTHIGGESFIPKDNWLTSQSLITFYEPAYQAGARISYETKKFTGQFYVINGNGIFSDNNKQKTFGAYFLYNLSDNVSLMYAGVIGNEEPDSIKPAEHQMHCFVATYNPFSKLMLKFQTDMAKKSIKNNPLMCGYSFSAKYFLNEKLNTSARFSYVDNSEKLYDYFNFKGWDLTWGLEYKALSNSYIRFETRYIKCNDKFKVFYDGNKLKDSRLEVMMNFGIWIN